MTIYAQAQWSEGVSWVSGISWAVWARKVAAGTGMYYKEEVSFGTQPANPFGTLRFTSESFSYNLERQLSKEIRRDRQGRKPTLVKAESVGGFNFEWSSDTFDTLLEGAFWEDWSDNLTIQSTGIGFSDSGFLTAGTGATDGTANFSLATVGQWISITGSSCATNNTHYRITDIESSTKIWVSPTPATRASGTDFITISGAYLRNGVIKKSYTFLREHIGLKENPPVNQYFTFTGMVCSSLRLDLAGGDIVKGNFVYLGSKGTLTQLSDVPYQANAPTTTRLLSCAVNVAELQMDGSDFALVESLSFTIDNHTRSIQALGFLGNCDIGVGRCDVQGSLEAFFYNETLYNKYLNGSTASLVMYFLDNDGNEYIFDIPKIKFYTNAVNASGQDASVTNSITFQALVDDIYGYTIQLSKL